MSYISPSAPEWSVLSTTEVTTVGRYCFNSILYMVNVASQCPSNYTATQQFISGSTRIPTEYAVPIVVTYRDDFSIIP